MGQSHRHFDGPAVGDGDALGMLSGAAKFRSKDPVINEVFMELALLIAPRGDTLEAMHIWSEENLLADVLSRIADDSCTLPAILAKVPRTPCREIGFLILGH